FRMAFDPEAPWALLGEPLDLVLAALDDRHPGSVPDGSVHLLGPRIIIEPEATVAPGAVIEGPAWIGAGASVRTGAYLRGGCWIGEGAVVGANTEIKRSILFPGARAPHLAYVGDSILGGGVNLGAGSVLSNFRHDGREILIPTDGGPIATGRRKLGAVLGDGVAVGCNSVFHPGVVMGRESQTYPGVMVRSGVYGERVMMKLRQATEMVEIIRN
ncbi:MAG: hypothetical protein PVG07_02885, partial [Acidobacteriota bacterium]